MLSYQTIYNVNQAAMRIKRDRYDNPWHQNDGNSRDGDEMQLFTFSKQATADSLANLDRCLNLAQQQGMDLLVITPSRLQIAGDGKNNKTQKVLSRLIPKDWLIAYNDWLQSTSDVRPSLENSSHGEYVEFYTYRKSLCVQEHQGVYDVATGQRIKNRREIIQRMWDLGFAAHRGRPLALARSRWAGDREELEVITALADKYWNRRHSSEAAKKMVSAYTSINRYCAWPGAW